MLIHVSLHPIALKWVLLSDIENADDWHRRLLRAPRAAMPIAEPVITSRRFHGRKCMDNPPAGTATAYTGGGARSVVGCVASHRIGVLRARPPINLCGSRSKGTGQRIDPREKVRLELICQVRPSPFSRAYDGSRR